MKNRIMVMAVSLLVCQMLFCSCSSDNAELPDMTSTGQQTEIQKQEEPSEVQQIQSKEKSTVKETQKPKEDDSKKSEASDSQWKYWFDEEHGVKGSGTQLDDGMEILVQSTGNAPYQAQVNYERVSLEKGKTYHIEFDYESDADLYWIYQVQQSQSPYNAYTNESFGKSGHYSDDFIMKVSDNNAVVTFSVNDSTITAPYSFKVDNFVLTEVTDNSRVMSDSAHIDQIFQWLQQKYTADANEYAQTLHDTVETALSNLNGNGKFDGVYHQANLPDEIQQQAWEGSMWYGEMGIEIKDDKVIACWTDVDTHAKEKQKYADQYLNAENEEWAELWADMGFTDADALHTAYGKLPEIFYGSYPKKTIATGETLSDDVSGFSDTEPDIEAVKNS